jgi:flagellin
MALHVNSNIPSLTAQRNLNSVTTRLSGNFSHLSSGLRIATAADDASGLGISERMRSQIRGLNAAAHNAQDGISYLQTAEGALGEISDIMTRMRELAVQSSSGTLSTDERTTLNGEFQKMKGQIDDLAKTEYNGMRVLSNNALVNFQVGTDNGDTISIANVDARTVALGITSDGVGTVANAGTAMTNLDAAIESVASFRGSRGATMNRLDAARQNIMTTSTNLAAAESRIRDVDMAFETSDMTRNQIIQSAATAVLAQANSNGSQALTLLG